MCNKDIRPPIPHYTTSTAAPKLQTSNSVPFVAFLLSMVTCLLVSVLVIGWMYLRYRRKEKNRLYALASTDSYVSGNSNLLQTLIGHSSGSGSGIPLLVSIYRLLVETKCNSYTFFLLNCRFKERLPNKYE